MLLAAGEKVEMNMSLETLLTSGAGSITEFDIMELFQASTTLMYGTCSNET